MGRSRTEYIFRGLRALALGTALLAASPVLGDAAALSWRPMPGTPPPTTTIEPALLRLTDGSLEVAYPMQGSDPGKEALGSAVITSSGRINATAPLTGDWDGLNNPAVVPATAGLRAYWGGIQDAMATTPVPGLETATAPGPGGPWDHQFGGIEVAACKPEYPPCPNTGLAELYAYGADVSAVQPAGPPLVAWAGTLGVYVRSGTTPSRDTDSGDANKGETPDDQEDPTSPVAVAQEGLDDPTVIPPRSFQADCCGYEPQLAIDHATGRPYVGWWSNATNHDGTFIQVVDPASGNPAGTPYLVPGSRGSSGLRARTPLTGLAGHPGVYTALPAGGGEKQVIMAGFGIESGSTFATRKYLVSNGQGQVRNTAVTSDEKGRLWVVWTRQGLNGIKISASRWDITTAKFTPPTTVDGPPGANDSFALDASGHGNSVDVLGTFGPTPGGGFSAIWHASLEPSETASIARVSVTKGHKATLTVRVSDAGKPLAGATVTAIGATSSAAGHRPRHRPHKARTNAAGIARLRLGPFHHTTTIRLKITKTGYTPRVVRARVKVRGRR